jgi:myo-inositol-1(or 4)-monophosphatase
MGRTRPPKAVTADVPTEGMEGLYRFAVEVARTAGAVIRERVGRAVDVHSKGLRDVLTEVDLAAERTIVEALRDQYPEHDILTEETRAGARRSRYQWVIDPLDGTGNFVRGYPCFSTSVALTQDDQPIVGAVYDPMGDRLFAAHLGGGATLNGRALQVSAVEVMLDTMIGMDWARDPPTRERALHAIERLAPGCGTLRVCGSAALGICYVGAGWWDAYWHLSLQPWDAAAGALIVREAGGQATNLAGEQWRLQSGPLLVSNGRLHGALIAYVGGSREVTAGSGGPA